MRVVRNENVQITVRLCEYTFQCNTEVMGALICGDNDRHQWINILRVRIEERAATHFVTADLSRLCDQPRLLLPRYNRPIPPPTELDALCLRPKTIFVEKIAAPWDVILCGDQIAAHRHDILYFSFDGFTIKRCIVGIEDFPHDVGGHSELSRRRELRRTDQPNDANRRIFLKQTKHIRKETQPYQDTPWCQIDLILRITLPHCLLIYRCGVFLRIYLDQFHLIAMRNIKCIEIRSYRRGSILSTLCYNSNLLIVHQRRSSTINSHVSSKMHVDHL